MPRFHSDSDSSGYSPRHHRSPRRRSPTPGPRRVRNLSPDDHHNHPRFQFEPHTPFYPVASGANGPGTRRPRSAGTDTFTTTTTTSSRTPTMLTPEDSTAMYRSRDRDRTRSRGRYTPSPSASSSSSDEENDRHLRPPHNKQAHTRSKSPSPLDKARSLLSSTFTPSTSGLGVGVLGAIVGGLAAREASEALESHGGSGHSHGHDYRRGYGGGHDHGRDREKEKHRHLISTVVGAAVGGLGANAIEKRIERGRKAEGSGYEREGHDRVGERDRERDGGRFGAEGGGGRRRSGEWRRY